MAKLHRVNRYAWVVVAAVVLAACANKMEPAQKLIGQIDSTVTAASADAEKYVPDQLKDVQGKLADLKASFDKKDYTAVITGAPAVLASAQGLAAAAAAKKDEIMQALNGNWSNLAGTLPDAVGKIQARITELGKNRRMARGIDLASAKSGLEDATSLWSKAQAAFAAGNLEEAVSTAKDVKSKVDAVAETIKLKLPEAAPAAPAASD